VVELNPRVIAANRLWFHLPRDDARLSVVQDDAGRWVADAAHLQTVHALCIDLYDHEAAAPVLDDEAFYRQCRSVLDDGGVLSVNLFGRDALFADSAARIAAAFGSDQVWRLQPTREGNSVVIATRGVTVPDRDTLTARAAHIQTRYGLPARKWLRMVRPLG
jgi:spermidine synthase